MLKSLVLPKLGDRVSDVLDKDADSLSEIVLEAAEHGLGWLRPVLHVATIINAILIIAQDSVLTAQSPYLAPTSLQGCKSSDILQDSLNLTS